MVSLVLLHLTNLNMSFIFNLELTTRLCKRQLPFHSNLILLDNIRFLNQTEKNLTKKFRPVIYL
jgi:hypothetical protein